MTEMKEKEMKQMREIVSPLHLLARGYDIIFPGTIEPGRRRGNVTLEEFGRGCHSRVFLPKNQKTEGGASEMSQVEPGDCVGYNFRPELRVFVIKTRKRGFIWNLLQKIYFMD